MPQAAAPPEDGETAVLAAFLARHGVIKTGVPFSALSLPGGVASDIVRIDWAGGQVVVKRALSRLRVAQEWIVPVARNAHEVAWLRRARAILPGCAPQVLAHDPAAGMFAMTFLDPATHPVWKEELRAGHADPVFGAAVGRTLGAIHAATAADPGTAMAFPHQAMFAAIRLEPYLGAAALAHPDLASPLHQLTEALLRSRLALVHGDISPKNILHAPDGTPVFLDAECACCGDPAFDAAFCLNHLLLKCCLVPQATASLLASFAAFADAWLAATVWEDRGGLERRVAALLPALMLARVDGKSPVEYIVDPADKQMVRAFSRSKILHRAHDLASLADSWRTHLIEHGLPLAPKTEIRHIWLQGKHRSRPCDSFA